MSPKAVLAFLVAAACVLAAAVYFNSRGASQPPVGVAPAEALFARAEWDVRSASAITLARAGEPEQTVVRTEDGAWMYRSGAIEWPAAVPESAMAVLAGLSPALVAAPEAEPFAAGGATLGFDVPGAGRLTVRVAASAIGGKSAVEIVCGEQRTFRLVEAALVQPLVEPGPRAWRVAAALPGAADASRVTLSDSVSALSLGKLDGVWDVRRPVAARASQGAVATLLGALAGVRVERFVDEARPDLAAMGLNKPGLIISVETDQRRVSESGDVKVTVRTRELYVGAAADARGDTRFVAADPDGSVVMVVQSAAISAIATSVRNYLAPTATAAARADVFMINIRDEMTAAAGAGESDAGAAATVERAFRRDMGRWVRLGADGGRTPAAEGEVDALLSFLAEKPGVPEPAEGAEPFRVLRRVELFDGEGDTLDILSLGYTSDAQFAARSGNLVVVYRDPPPEVLELPEPSAVTPAAAGPAGLNQSADAPTSK